MIHVEPSVTMEQLVRAAQAYGMVPKVVAPFRHATVGGAVRLYASLASYSAGAPQTYLPSLPIHPSIIHQPIHQSDHGVELLECVPPSRLLPRLLRLPDGGARQRHRRHLLQGQSPAPTASHWTDALCVIMNQLINHIVTTARPAGALPLVGRLARGAGHRGAGRHRVRARGGICAPRLLAAAHRGGGRRGAAPRLRLLQRQPRRGGCVRLFVWCGVN